MSQRRTDPPTLPELRNFLPVGLTPQEEDRRRLYTRCQQTLSCCSAMLTMFTVGTVYGWSMTSLPRLKSVIDENVPLKIGQYEYSWITSLIVPGSIFGSFAGAQLADRFGRKYCLLVCSAMITAGWFIIYAATSVQMLYLARVTHGIGVGIARMINPMYVSEVSHINIRGPLVVLMIAIAYIGTIITCILEFWHSYESQLVTLIVISFIPIFSNTCLPETPYFLVAKGRIMQACKSLTYYKGIIDPNEAKTEIRALRAQTRYELHPQSRYELDQQSRRDLPSQSRTDLPSESRTDLPSESRTDLPSESRTDLPSESRTDLPSESRTDLPSESRTDVPSESRTDLPSQSRTDLPAESRTDLPSQSGSNLLPQSIYERLADPIQQVDTEHMSDLHLPSTSRAPARSVVRSEVIPAVHQRPRGESLPQASRALYSQSTSELQSRARSDSRASDDMDEIHMDGTKYTGFTKLKCILHRSNNIALYIMFSLIMANHLGGHFITMQYPEKLLQELNIVIGSYIATYTVQLVNILSILFTVHKLDFVGRRTLLILPTFVSCGTLIILAYYHLLAEKMLQILLFKICLPIVLIIYLVTFQIGLGTIPTVLLCELFPMELRGFVIATFVLFDSIVGFCVSKLYQVMNDNVGTFWIDTVFATSCCLAFLMVYIRMPETKGKTYNEIKALLDGKKLHSSNEEAVIDESDIHSL